MSDVSTVTNADLEDAAAAAMIDSGKALMISLVVA
jgi:hypothetical protein